MRFLPLIVLSISFLVSPLTSSATTFTVSNTNDAGAGSLRQAIIDANGAIGADDIDFVGINYPATITLTTGELQILDDLLIDGPGRDSLIVSGNNSSRCFRVESGLNVEIRKLNIESSILSAGSGAGIYSLSDLTVKDCYFYGNQASIAGGGSIAVIGASLELDSCEFFLGIAESGGGVYVTNGSCDINNCTFDECISFVSFGGAIYVINTPLTINNSFLKFNSGVTGGAIAGLDSPITATNCTFSENPSTFGGDAIYSTNSGVGDASVTLMNITMIEYGIAIQIENTGGLTPVFTTTNSIFDNSYSFEQIGLVTTVSNGYNICSNNNMDAFLTNAGDLTSTDPLLSGAAENGGFTKTCMTNCYSPAINAGTALGAPVLDQRGIGRLGVTDIGAYENINPPQPPYNVAATICYGDTYSVGANTYDTTGVYYDTLNASTTCDSIIITTLTVDSLDKSITVNSPTLTSNQTGGTYQWFDCDSNAVITGETNQSFTPTTNGNYAVIVSIGSCSDTSDCASISDVGISDLESSEILIYPNPSTGAFSVEFGDSNFFTEVRVYNLSGQEVHRAYIDQNIITLNPELPSGTYILELKSENKIIRKKIIIQ